MANRKINELQSRTPALSDLILVGDPSSGYSYKCTVTALATIIETDIADGYVTIGTTQTISGAKTFSNNLTLTSVVNTPTDPDKFLTLNASNVVTYRTGAEVLSDIGGVGGSGTTNYLPKFSATTTLANSQIFDNGTNIGIATATPDATARVQINKTDGYGLYLNYNTSTGSGVSTTALYAINTTASSGYAAVIEEKTPNTTAGQYPFVIKHSLSSGTAGVGFGTGVHFQLLDDAGTSKTTQLTIENIDAAAATYKTRYRFNVQNNGSSTPVVYINGTGLGVFTASPSVALDITGEGKFSTINNATTDTDKFLVSDSGVLKYRTGAEVLSDIGGQGALTLTTSGSSGAATLVGNTLNIPNYGSALSGYVPYTGATTNVNLGTRYLQANYLVVDGQSNATGINFKQYSSVSFNGDGYTAMGPVSVDKMFFNFAQGNNIFKIFYFDVSGITGNATRAYTMPNSDGTLALTSQIPTVSGTTNYIPKFTSSSAIGNSMVTDDGTTVAVNGVSTVYFKVKASANSGIDLLQESSGTGYLWNRDNAGILFGTNNTERMRLDASGNLGLGNSAPSYKFDILGSSTNGIGQIIKNSNSNSYFTIDVYGTNGFGVTNWPYSAVLESVPQSTGGLVLSAYSNGIYFQTGARQTRMTLDASGNLGLGVTPSAWSVTGKVFEFGGAGGSASLFDNGINDTWYSSNAYYNGTNWIYKSTGTATQYYQGNGGQHRWFTAASGTAGTAISFTQAMTLDASGRLGIGTTSPGDKLQVDGNVYANAFHAVGSIARFVSGGGTFIAGLNGSSYGYIQSYSDASGTGRALAINPSGGNVGIGTTSPTFAGGGGLQINTSGTDTRLHLTNTTTGITGIDGFELALVGNDIYYDSKESSGSQIFYTAGSERMRITSGGNVGIGTSNPNVYGNGFTNQFTVSTTSGYANITVAGSSGNSGGIDFGNQTVRHSGIYALDGSNLAFYTNGSNSGSGLTERMRITSGGNVGIGSSNPDTKLHLYTSNGIKIQATSNSDLPSLLVIDPTNSYGWSKIGGGLMGSGKGYTYFSNWDGSGVNEKMRLTGDGELLINTTSDAGDYKLQVNGGSYVTGGNFVMATGDIWIQQGGQGILSPNANRVITINNGAVEIGGSIKTAAPSGGTAQPWKLGSKVTQGGILSLDVSNYIEVEINGTFWKLGIVN